MKKIVKLIIRGASGYGPVDEAYNDKLTVDASAISYELKPVIESGIRNSSCSKMVLQNKQPALS